MRKTKIKQRGDEVKRRKKRRRERVKYGHGRGQEGGREGVSEASHDGDKE